MENDQRHLPTHPQENRLVLSATALEAIEARLASANDMKEIVTLTQVRGEILRQDNERREAFHKRWLQRVQFYSKLAMAPVVMAVGVALVLKGFLTAGLFIIGAGLSAFAPDYVRTVLKRGGGKDATE